ncbi:MULTISPECIES: response regulator [unclassified Sulfitobacter]|uniref:response regulator n=1 Tax=unclassified Sulfitobacter TaxID=196795 RepID=UPI0031FF1903
MTVDLSPLPARQSAQMCVLIVESRPELGNLWQRHLARQNMRADCVRTQNAATAHIAEHVVDVIILDLVIEGGSALAVSDFAQSCQPDARVIFVTNTSFFSDGSIFGLAKNARAFLPAGTAPEDLAVMVEYYGTQGRPA